MSTLNSRWLLALGASLSIVGLTTSTPDTAAASEERCPSELRADPFSGDGFTVVASKDLYRVQDRPYAHIPTGAKVLVRAPAGVTEADLHHAATHHVSESSPLAVPGARLSVRRSGELYELHVTAAERGAAREIQRRAKAL
jgi:hypothetical protein